MHYLTLVAVDIPMLLEDEEENRKVEDRIRELRVEEKEGKSSFISEYLIRKLNGRLSTFARAVEEIVDWELAPYDENNEEYQVFIDQTEGLEFSYNNQKEDCIKLANGKIVSTWDNEVYGKYLINEGKVYQKQWGPLQHAKRTKKSRRMSALPQYPVNKRYKSFDEYADTRSCYDEEHESYGYYYNPNSFYDWYEIGGRWPNVFLVKADCKEYSTAGKGSEDSLGDAPDGYIWVSAARKKDIEWDVQNKWIRQMATERYHKYSEWFFSGVLPDNSYAQITETGISRFGTTLYLKDETLEEYLYREGFAVTSKHTPLAFAFLEAGCWKNKYNMEDYSEDAELEYKWSEILADFIDGLDDNTVIVGVDNHQ